MTNEDIARIAAAIATANGHSDVAAYSASVVDAWKAAAPKRRDGDVGADVGEARDEAKASREG